MGVAPGGEHAASAAHIGGMYRELTCALWCGGAIFQAFYAIFVYIAACLTHLHCAAAANYSKCS